MLFCSHQSNNLEKKLRTRELVCSKRHFYHSLLRNQGFNENVQIIERLKICLKKLSGPDDPSSLWRTAEKPRGPLGCYVTFLGIIFQCRKTVPCLFSNWHKKTVIAICCCRCCKMDTYTCYKNKLIHQNFNSFDLFLPRYSFQLEIEWIIWQILWQRVF